MNKKFNKLSLSILLSVNFMHSKTAAVGENYFNQTCMRTCSNYIGNNFKSYISPYLFSAVPYFATRYSSIQKSLIWKGKFVSVDKNGVMNFNLPDMISQNHSKNHRVEKFPTTTGPIKFDPERNLYYHDIVQDAPSKQKKAYKEESIIDNKKIGKVISNKETNNLPYNSCGMLDMIFNGKLYHGSAYAVAKNILFTAGHNIAEYHNGKSQYSTSTIFWPKLSSKDKKNTNHSIHGTPYLYDFDDLLDFGIVILNSNLDANDFIKPKINLQYDGKIYVIGFPGGEPYMIETDGMATIKEPITAHFANTKPGNSGSPGLDNMKQFSLITHTSGSFRGNFGVSNSIKIATFVDKAIKKHTERYDTNAITLSAISVVKELRAIGTPIKKIIQVTNLSEAEITKLLQEKK